MTNRKSGAAQDWQHLRLWQIQPIRDVLLLAAIAGVLYIGYVLRIVTVPILLALALAYLFEPLVRAVTRRTKYVSRPGMAVAIIVFAGVAVIVPVVLGIGFGVVQGATTAGNIASHTSKLITSVQDNDPQKRNDAFKKLPAGWRPLSARLFQLRTEVEQYQKYKSEPPKQEPKTESKPETKPEPGQPNPEPTRVDPANGESPSAPHFPEWKMDLYNALDLGIKSLQQNASAIGTAIGQRALGSGTEAFNVAVRTLGSVGVLIFQGFLTAFFFFFFSTGWGKVLSFWESLIPQRKKGRVVELLNRMDRVIAGFIRGRLIICLVLSIVITIAYFIIGVPVPLILGPIVGLLFLIPFTHWIGAILVMLAMWLGQDQDAHGWQTRWWWIVFAPIGVNMIGQVLDDYILTPSIQGKNTDLNMPSILFASIAGGALAGFYGLLIAIPAAACIKILLKEVFWPRFEGWAKGREKDFLPISHEDPKG